MAEQSYLARFNALHEFIKQHKSLKVLEFKTFPPVTDEEIKNVEEKIGSKLPEQFLKYFKESNGYQLRYCLAPLAEEQDEDEEVEELGAVMILGLQEMFDRPISNDSDAGEYTLETLGGRDDHLLRSKMFKFDNYNAWLDESEYYSFYYVVEDDVLLFSSDYEACISDAHPITVPSYMELVLATAGLTERKTLLERGCGGNWKVARLDRKACESIGTWDEVITKNLKNCVTKGFYDLTASLTDNRGYHLRFMKQ